MQKTGSDVDRAHRSSGHRGGDLAAGSSIGKRTLVQLLEAVATAAPGRAQDGAPGDTQRVANGGLTGPAQPLPHLDRIQALFGRHDVRGVRAHVGGPAADAAGAMGAQAYATGSSIAFAQTPDLHTAAHEAAHVVQQRAGVHLAGGVGRAGDEHERHADAVADRVVQGRSAEDLLDAYTGGGGGGGRAVQHRQIDPQVYARYDPETLRDPTRAMIEAAGREDSVEALRVQATQHHATLQNLAADPLVSSKAAPRVAEVTKTLAGITMARQLITAALDRIVAGYGEALDDTIIARCTPKSQRGPDRLAAIKAKAEQDALITKKIDGFVKLAGKQLDNATAAAKQIETIVDELSAEAARQRKGKTTYENNLPLLTQSRDTDLAGRATDLGLDVPDIEQLYAQAKVHGEANEWVKAGARSGDGRAQIEKLEQEIHKAQRDIDAYGQLEGQLGQLKQIRTSFTDLRIQRGPLDDVEDLVKQARDAYAKKQWKQARSLADQAVNRIPDLNDLVAKFDAYRTGNKPKLLQGTILDVHHLLTQGGAYTNPQALTALEATYHDQCAVTRLNWLQHLNIAGANVKIGSDSDHYTTFNDSVPAFATLRVDLHPVDALCDQLFASVATTLQIHATRVVGGTRYHRYWDGNYSQNVHDDDLANTSPVVYGQLNARYATMVHDMTDGVRLAKEAHGRVSNNQYGHQITVRLV